MVEVRKQVCMCKIKDMGQDKKNLSDLETIRVGTLLWRLLKIFLKFSISLVLLVACPLT